MTEEFLPKPLKAEFVGRGRPGPGRPPGAPNERTRDIRAALRDLAENNHAKVQGWLDSVAATDPAEALRLYLALLRYVTPTLAAVAGPPISLMPRAVRDLSYDELVSILYSTGQKDEGA
jgi:hypothetical protein